MAMTTSAARPFRAVPELQNGDHLSREEFERRYDAMPELKKAELIEGVVHMSSPVRQTQHAGPHFQLITWLGHYCVFSPGVIGGDNGTLRLNLDNEPQPDAYLFIDPVSGGQAGIDVEGYVESAPELVAEVAASSASYDLHTKHSVYRRNQVREYFVWRVLDQAIDWFVLRGSKFEQLLPDEKGILRSEILPGLWLDTQALLDGNLPQVFAVVQQGLATPEHAAVGARLQKR